jgi:hypothetical protein
MYYTGSVPNIFSTLKESSYYTRSVPNIFSALKENRYHIITQSIEVTDMMVHLI